MQQTVRIFILILVSLFVGLAFTCIEPYPKHSSLIWGIGSLIFLVVELAQRTTRGRIAWNVYGLAIFGCSLMLNWWYWWGLKEKGWWYPPQLPIVQQFYQVRGDYARDADVGNFFLLLWFIITAVFIAYRVRLSSNAAKVSP